MDEQAQAAFDRAWRHFQLHSQQRIAVFNFFVASSGLLLTGLAYVITGSPARWWLGVGAGALVVVLAGVFWKLDQRSAQIIKVSEAEIERLEAASHGCSAVFSAVSALPVAASAWDFKSVWTFGRAFRLLFLAVALLGISGTVTSIWRGVSTRSGETRTGVAGTGASSQVVGTGSKRLEKPTHDAASRRPEPRNEPSAPPSSPFPRS